MSGGFSGRYRWLWALVLLIAGGCCSPHPPAPAVPKAASFSPVQQVDPFVAPPGVRVMIAYGQYTCLHTAMWLTASNEEQLFWDPAGGYGLHHLPYVQRSRDIVSEIPTFAEYLAFREEVGTYAVEIFDFRLRPELAQALFQTLDEGRKRRGEYDPLTPGMFCSHAVSGFLRRYAVDRFPLEKAQLYPHDFAADLYRFSPDQVILCQRKQITDPLTLSQCKTVVMPAALR